MARRTRYRLPTLDPSLWKVEGESRIAKPEAIQAVIASSGYSDAELRRKLGAAYKELGEALEGKPVGIWTANFIESAIKPRSDSSPCFSGPSDPYKNVGPIDPDILKHK
jgi:hypothetical protein